jgi:hypothetical protein
LTSSGVNQKSDPARDLQDTMPAIPFNPFDADRGYDDNLVDSNNAVPPGGRGGVDSRAAVGAPFRFDDAATVLAR